MPEDENKIVVEVDTKPSKEGVKTSTFQLNAFGMLLVSILPFALAFLESYYRTLPVNSWVAIPVIGLIALGYGAQRLLATSKERDTIARVAEAEATIASSKPSSTNQKELLLEIALQALKQQFDKKDAVKSLSEFDYVSAGKFPKDESPLPEEQGVKDSAHAISDEELTDLLSKQDFSKLPFDTKKDLASIIIANNSL